MIEEIRNYKFDEETIKDNSTSLTDVDKIRERLIKISENKINIYSQYK